MQTEKILVSKKEAARLLSLSVRSIEYLIELGELKSRRIGRRVLISRKELDQFVRRDHQIRQERDDEHLTARKEEKEDPIG